MKSVKIIIKKIVKYKLTPEVLNSKKALIEWLIDIHNEVNKSNNKPELTYKEVIQTYINLYQSDNRER